MDPRKERQLRAVEPPASAPQSTRALGDRGSHTRIIPGRRHSGEQSAVVTLLETMASELNMDAAFVCEISGANSAFTYVEGDGGRVGLNAGAPNDAVASLCRRVLEGRLPPTAGSTQPFDKRAGALPGAYVIAPLVFENDRVLGAVGCLSAAPVARVQPDDTRVVRVVAAAVASELEARNGQERQRRERYTRVAKAITCGVIEMAFQPIVDLRTGRLESVEALSRFAAEPKRTPDVWFAEGWSVGLGVELEITAVRSALAALPHLADDVALAFNVAPRTVIDARFGETLANAPGRRLVIELTEHAPVDDYRELDDVLTRLRARGMRLAIDDAGAGFASFQHILRLRPDVIKLDRSLTSSVDTDPARHALAASLTTFASQLGAHIVAEGIETAGELNALRRLGVSYGQGYYLARPGPLNVKHMSLPPLSLRRSG